MHCVLATLTLLLTALCGCLPHDPRADLVILNGAEPESLDPALITGQPDMRVVRCLFEGLTRLDPQDARPTPGLAERWEISPDQTTYTFFLRSNAVWSTGQPITSEDVVYSWLRALKPETAAGYAGQLYFIENAQAYNVGEIKDPARVGVEAVDPRTLRVRLTDPTPFFLDLCAFPTLAVVPRQAIEAHGERWLLADPVPSSGPFQLASWRIHDKIRVERNPLYWDAASVRSGLVDFLPIESPAAALNLYDTGEADIIWDKNLIPSQLMDVLRERPDCHTFDYLGTFFVRFNTTRPPFHDVRVRRALALVVDKQRIVERITRGGEKVASHFTPKGMPQYRPPEGLGYVPVLARRLLADAGYPDGDGFPIFEYLFKTGRVDEQIGVELQAMFAEALGLRMELRQTEWKVYLNAQNKLDYDLSRSSWVGDYLDPNTFLDIFTSHSRNNRTGWADARYDILIREANRQPDPAVRERLLQEAETLLVREAVPIIPVYFYAGVNFFDTNRVGGVHFNLLDEHPVRAIGRVDEHNPSK